MQMDTIYQWRPNCLLPGDLFTRMEIKAEQTLRVNHSDCVIFTKLGSLPLTVKNFKDALLLDEVICNCNDLL